MATPPAWLALLGGSANWDDLTVPQDDGRSDGAAARARPGRAARPSMQCDALHPGRLPGHFEDQRDVLGDVCLVQSDEVALVVSREVARRRESAVPRPREIRRRRKTRGDAFLRGPAVSDGVPTVRA
jgi:hypothetical protein